MLTVSGSSSSDLPVLLLLLFEDILLLCLFPENYSGFLFSSLCIRLLLNSSLSPWLELRLELMLSEPYKANVKNACTLILYFRHFPL